MKLNDNVLMALGKAVAALIEPAKLDLGQGQVGVGVNISVKHARSKKEPQLFLLTDEEYIELGHQYLLLLIGTLSFGFPETLLEALQRAVMSAAPDLAQQPIIKIAMTLMSGLTRLSKEPYVDLAFSQAADLLRLQNGQAAQIRNDYLAAVPEEKDQVEPSEAMKVFRRYNLLSVYEKIHLEFKKEGVDLALLITRYGVHQQEQQSSLQAVSRFRLSPAALNFIAEQKENEDNNKSLSI